MKRFIYICVIICLGACEVEYTPHNYSTAEQYSYTYTSYGFREIIQRNQALQIVEKRIVDTVRENLIRITIYDNTEEIIQKKYVSLNEDGVAVSQTDSVADDEHIIAEYTYEYNEDGYIIKTEISGIIYSDDMFQTVSKHVEKSIEYIVENGNVIEEMHEKSILRDDEVLFTERKEYVYTYLKYDNTHGIQGFQQPFYGEYNEKLLSTADYAYYTNNTLQKSGTYTYSYEEEKSRIVKQKKVNRPDGENDIYTVMTVYSIIE
ncbi:MAG: hypothetical protein R6U95_05400 [Bacteroidales bacterium]